MENHPKPPLGIKPRWLFIEERIQELELAMKRYLESLDTFPEGEEYQAWREEALELRYQLAEIRDQDIRIPKEIRNGTKTFYVLVVGDDLAGDGGEPIVWEHTFPHATTLAAVKNQQKKLADRYGTSWIAECRIIPETKSMALVRENT